MKKTILLPLFLGLMLAGCGRTNTDSQKVSSNDQSDPNKPTYNDQAITAKKDTTDQSKVAANPEPATPGADTNAATKSTTDSTAVASNPTPAASADKTESTPAASPDMKSTSESPSVASNPTPATTPDSSADKPAAAASSSDMASNASDAAKPDLAARLTEWKLTPDDIKGEVDAGRVVRSRTAGANEPTGPMDSVLTDQITTRLHENSDTSALKLDISADKGVVTLNGSAESLDQIGKAIALSLDTPGVTQTISQIKLEATK